MKKITSFLAVILFVSCTSNTIYKKPKNLIPKDTMVFLLTDLYLASASYFRNNKQQQRKVNYAPLVYNKYHIDSIRFKESNLYYTSKIDEYEELFLLIKTNLTAQKLKLQKELNLFDSLNKKPGKILDTDIQRLKNRE